MGILVMKVKALFPRASQDFLAINSESLDSEPKSPIRDESLAAPKGKEENSKRRILRYTSYRCRLTDPDNICPKYFTDALRYCGAIPNDTLQDIELQIRQKKVAHRSQEKTLIELEA